MTTIGVKSAPTKRILPMNVPSYSYHYPSMYTVKLAAVKEGLYHPSLPTFRRMDMDTAAHKLPGEHCRTTTSYCQEEFRRAKTSLFEAPPKPLASVGITETGRQLHRACTAPEELKTTRGEWSEFLDRCPERFSIRLPELPEDKDLRFCGYAVRYLRPEVTASWKYSLRQEPSLNQYGQKPIPANVYARYRDTAPRYNRNIATKAWR